MDSDRHLADVREVFEIARDGVHQFCHGFNVFVGESGRGFGQLQLHLGDCLGVSSPVVLLLVVLVHWGPKQKMLIAPGASVESSRKVPFLVAVQNPVGKRTAQSLLFLRKLCR